MELGEWKREREEFFSFLFFLFFFFFFLLQVQRNVNRFTGR